MSYLNLNTEISEKNSAFDQINENINLLLNLISKSLKHDLSLLVYSYDIDLTEKLNVFEISFDNFKYFNEYHSVVLNNDYYTIAQYLFSSTRRFKTDNHLNLFYCFNVESDIPSSKIREVSNLLKSLHSECLKLQNIDNLNIFNYLQYSLDNKIKIFTF